MPLDDLQTLEKGVTSKYARFAAIKKKTMTFLSLTLKMKVSNSNYLAYVRLFVVSCRRAKVCKKMTFISLYIIE